MNDEEYEWLLELLDEGYSEEEALEIIMEAQQRW